MSKLHRPVQLSRKAACLDTGVAIAGSMMCLIVAPTMAEDSICGFDLEGRFIESAPRDSFVYSNQSGKAWNIATIQIDMSQSAGKLIFDTTDGGDGVEVYQPFQVSGSGGGSTEARLRDIPVPSDGDQTIALNFSYFPPAASFAFTIDVDDQLAESDLGQIRVSDGEIAGSVLSVTAEVPGAENATLRGIYDNNSAVRITSNDC